MKVNRYQPHLLVLPEDDKDRQLANGFFMDPHFASREYLVLEEAGGWLDVLEQFKSDLLPEMHKFPGRLVVLLIDFDHHLERLEAALAQVPREFHNRVFILGSLGEPEELCSAGLGSCETIGKALAQDCLGDTMEHWNHPLLRHNLIELERMRARVRPILFA
jgi:hypothetical protein